MPQNRLAAEPSAYLQQHAAHPVDWYPWGEQAFEAARTSGRPILLSIGYSACHWCHVMAHESFEDPATAALMNELFVNIKVDREERPDIDRIQQLSHQLLTRRAGGWPLTMFLTHDDRRPFFGGTYFPPAARGGMPDFRTVLARVARYYRERQEELRGQTRALVEAIAAIEAPADAATGPLDDTPLQALRAQLAERFDREHGGWSGAPKFPHPGIIQRLLRDWHRSRGQPGPDLHALFMATLTLRRMSDGGLFDQLGGGFFRYSVDERWEIPHFEKMLGDNGAMLSACADVAAATGDADFAAVTRATADFLLREMRSADGAFCSSLDADSEGHEGRYYLWTREEVATLLDADTAALFRACHGLDLPPNFGDRWHLVAVRATAQRLEQAHRTLLAARAARVPPGKDDKVLVAWNALAIHGLADAARALGEDSLANAAATALDHLRQVHWRDGRLLAVSRDGTARLDASLDDHALLIDAILALLTVRFDAPHLQFATALAEALLQRFEDREHGGFFFTAHDHEALFHRSRSFDDDATPSGNAIAASALQRLGWLLGEPRYLQAAERTLRAAWSRLQHSPLAMVHMATALEEHLLGHAVVILRGPGHIIDDWRRRLQRVWRPRVTVMAIPDGTADLPQALAAKMARGDAMAWLCRGSTCGEPMRDIAAVEAALEEAAGT